MVKKMDVSDIKEGDLYKMEMKGKINYYLITRVSGKTFYCINPNGNPYVKGIYDFENCVLVRRYSTWQKGASAKEMQGISSTRTKSLK
mgnify:CR=1 FL=1